MSNNSWCVLQLDNTVALKGFLKESITKIIIPEANKFIIEFGQWGN